MAHTPAALVLALAAALAFHAPAEGQDPRERGMLSVALTTPAVVFPTPGIEDYDAGWLDHEGVIVTVASRPNSEPWELRLRASTATMGGYGKPIADILWRHDGSAVWTPLTGSDQAVLQGFGDQDVTLHFRVRLDWMVDSPDTYSAGLAFSAIRP